MKTLNREPIAPNQAILDGRMFENMVYACAEGQPPQADHKWYKAVCEAAEIVKGGAFQVKLYKDITINNVDFLLYGILDVLKAGSIQDLKLSKSYHQSKYLDSPQHPMYFELCPEAREFIYVVSDGKDIYKERYLREDTDSIEKEIKMFMDFLDERNLVKVYCDKWKSKF